MTTYENIALPLRVLGKDESNYRAEVIELLPMGWFGRANGGAAGGSLGR